MGVNLRERKIYSVAYAANVAWEDFSNVENGQKKIWGRRDWG